MWQDTLRQRQPYLDGMKGLRRLTLNHNPALGDQGAAAIAEVLAEDLWIKGEHSRERKAKELICCGAYKVMIARRNFGTLSVL